MNTNDSDHPTTTIWDAHACPTLEPGADLSTLYNYKDSGFTYISLNIGFDPQDINGIKNFSNYVKEYISTNSGHFVYADKPYDVIQAKIENKLAIGFDIEGISPLLKTDSYIDTLNELGVKQLGLVYNKTNLVAGGCNDTDTGLTRLGKDIVKQLNESGIIIDCSHMGEKSSLEVISSSDHPVIFSHSNLNQLHNHPRNMTFSR
ncbi:MAG: membrane dipeptidase [Coxiellaceae bacterium]|nr:membrane dipeptidase [Coxiellaceae bacterium]